MQQEAYYEWKPALFPKCKNFGHELQECRKLQKEAQKKGKQLETEKQVMEKPNQAKAKSRGETTIGDKLTMKLTNGDC